MYVMHRGPEPKRRIQAIALVIVFFGMLGGLGYGATRILEAESTLSPTPPPKVSKVLGSKTKTRTFTAGQLSINLPQDWEEYPDPEAPKGSVSWRNTAGNKGLRVIRLFTAGLPADYAVNHVLVVDPGEGRVLVTGGVSDNCTNFSSKGRDTAGDGRETARWNGVPFSCDTARFARNVVGLSSNATQDGVAVVGAGGTKHSFSMTYNDADATPDFSIFTAAVDSIRVQ